jgi:hypothetical protein
MGQGYTHETKGLLKPEAISRGKQHNSRWHVFIRASQSLMLPQTQIKVEQWCRKCLYALCHQPKLDPAQQVSDCDVTMNYEVSFVLNRF